MGQRVLNYLISMMILLVSPAGSAGSDLIVNCLGDRLPLSLRHEKALSSDLAKNIHPLTPEPGGTSEYSTRIVSEVFSTPERFEGLLHP
ncbi:MAG: hypothetical protein HYT77_06410 [Deltaproteobacteria bacterium]|nr:hypothetical protein [Deltaproteobacteria bacterium]